MSSSPRSPSLEPPPKRVEVEDSGAHNLESSSEDEFSDAKEAITSPTRPITRVERVDTQPAFGEIPGSESYEKRAEDARPDVIAVQPGSEPAHINRHNQISTSGKDTGEPSSSPVPKTVITRVDSLPVHGEVPGTKAAALRSTDAKPDVIEKQEDDDSCNLPNRTLREEILYRDKSPIAADGGFGPMEPNEPLLDEPTGSSESKLAIGRDSSKKLNQIQDVDPVGHEEEASGDDFDEFAEGEDGDDFGDFDDFQDDDTQPDGARGETSLPLKVSYPIPDFSLELPKVSELEGILATHLGVLFPATEQARDIEPPDLLPEGNTAFLSDRSYSLWQQLIAPPPLQPPDWVRSRIRRLFLVSLGVPVDLDEILPKSKQKKLVLPYNPTEHANKPASKGKEPKAANNSKEASSKRTRGPPPPPEFDIEEVEKLCKKTDADLEDMNDDELKAHVTKLEKLAEVGKTVLQYWVKRKEIAVDEKEAFDSVVESLIRHARRVRK